MVSSVRPKKLPMSARDIFKLKSTAGYREHARNKGFGVLRARQVLTWLQLKQDHLNLAVAGSVHEHSSKLALRLAELLPVPGPASAALSQFGSGTSAASKYSYIGQSGTGR